MKKSIFLLTLIILTAIQPFSLADDIETEIIDIEEIKGEAIQTSAQVNSKPNINSRAAIVIDRDSKSILYGKNENEKRAMASTTKIMTAIIALENCKLDEEIIVSKKAAGVGGSRLGLNSGDKLTMNDLIYGMMLRSGNDAAAQIAETIGGGYEGFSNLMNKKAADLGLTNTHFITPHGLDDPNHYTTAYELALLTDYALKNETFAKIVSSKTKVILINRVQREIYNTNELLGNLNGINGVKTGFTNNAGRCLVCSCTRGNMNIISVVLGADTKKFRTKDSIQIIEYAYKNYKMINLKEKIEAEFESWKTNYKTTIYKGEKQSFDVTLDKIPYGNYPVKTEDKESINFEFTEENYFEAPVEKGKIIGNITVKIGNEKICSINIFTKEEVLKKNVWQYLEELMKEIGKYI